MTILDEAETLVQGARQKNYGHPLDNWSQTAALWTTYLGPRLVDAISADDAALMMILMKVSRLSGGFHHDSLVDVAGYARCVQMMNEEREKRGVE